MNTVEVRNLTRQLVPRVLFNRIARVILPEWEISLVFVGAKRARDINIATRKKTYTPNVLSYPLGKKRGEVIICPTQAKKEARKFTLTNRSMMLLLFIHALLHLKGYRHGTTMEEYEHALLAQFTK